ncbi:MAG: hypothetical protein K0S42_3433 [Microvirga sp.]|nr:hypothetical protein [Microvirga sp.]
MKCTRHRCQEDLRDGSLETLVGVGDDQLDALEAAAYQTAQELDPEGGGFRLAKPEDLAAAVLVDAGGDYCRDRHDAAVLADLDVGRVQPEVGPLAVQLEERQHARVDVLAQRRNLRLGDMPSACTRSSTLRVETPWIQASWITAVRAFSAVLRGSRKAGK